jgi:uncharacterized membrane protein YeaQ/YmgE (transglycosylase-associated protein family)
MIIATWMLAGAIVGWLCYSVLGVNEARGKAVSIFIGAMGGVVGGSMIAPMLTAAAAPGALSLAGLLVAAAVAAALLAIGELLSYRWGV